MTNRSNLGERAGRERIDRDALCSQPKARSNTDKRKPPEITRRLSPACERRRRTSRSLSLRVCAPTALTSFAVYLAKNSPFHTLSATPPHSEPLCLYRTTRQSSWLNKPGGLKHGRQLGRDLQAGTVG